MVFTALGMLYGAIGIWVRSAKTVPDAVLSLTLLICAAGMSLVPIEELITAGDLEVSVPVGLGFGFVAIGAGFASLWAIFGSGLTST